MIRTEEREPVSVIRIDRHEQRNALDVEHCDDLRAALGNAVAAGSRVVVVTGEGSSFCSGADLDQVYGEGFRNALYAMLRAITEVPVPVVAAVNGPAIGAGTQLAIACDLRFADPSAVFAVPTAALGLAVDPWTVRRLGLVAGAGAARTMLLACERVGATQARSCGLVDHLCGFDEALERAEAIAALAPLTLAYSKLALRRLFEPDTDDPMLREAFEAVWASDDRMEGHRARQGRRAPRFQGR